METNEQITARTKKWITDVVIGHRFCPFAAKAVMDNALRFAVDDVEDMAHVLESFANECRFLEENPTVETSLLILPVGFDAFDVYLDLVALSEDLLETLGYEGVFQVASFHPAYLFEGSDDEDAANYTNRSPYPMLHLLREESVEKALETMTDPDEIPNRNIQYAREKGIVFMRKLMQGE